MKHYKQHTFGLGFVILLFFCATTMSSAAQDTTHPPTTSTIGEPKHEVRPTHVQNAEVIHVSGHEIVVELENGKFELLNLGEDQTFQVDGKDLRVHELRPGTKLSQDIHTITTPQEVKTMRTLKGTVIRVTPPRYLLVSLPGGGTSEFIVPDKTVFHIEGEHKTVFDLRKGMNVSATVLTTQPLQSITTHTVVTGQAPPPLNVAFEGPILIEDKRQVPTITASVEEPPLKELPKTAGPVPFIGLLGLLSLGIYAAIRMSRRRAA